MSAEKIQQEVKKAQGVTKATVTDYTEDRAGTPNLLILQPSRSITYGVSGRFKCWNLFV